MTRGEVWWLEDPELGRRPACILTRETAIPVLNRLIVALASTRVRGIPTEVALDEGDGLPRPCALSFDSIRMVSKAQLVERITRLSSARMHEVCRAFRLATDC